MELLILLDLVYLNMLRVCYFVCN